MRLWQMDPVGGVPLATGGNWMLSRVGPRAVRPRSPGVSGWPTRRRAPVGDVEG